MTEWWRGKVHDQATHAAINAEHYPGTRQLCIDCDQPTGRCEDDSIFYGEIGPLCEECYIDYSEDQPCSKQGKSNEHTRY